MDSDRRRQQSRTPLSQAVATSYQSWRSLRPHLFDSTARKDENMDQPSNNTVYRVSATADGQFQTLDLRAQHDARLKQSLISDTIARRSGGSVTALRLPTIVTDNSGRCWTAKHSITLRWHYANEPQSFEETFLVVEGLCILLLPLASLPRTNTQAEDNGRHALRPGNDHNTSDTGKLDVLFRSSIPRPLNSSPDTDIARTYRIIEKPETSSQKRERLEREHKARKRHEQEEARQATMARGGLEQMKGVLRGEIDRRGKGGKGG